MIGSGKVIRVGGFNLNTICSSLLGNRQGGLSPIFKALFAGSERGFAYDPSDLTAAKAAFRRNLLTETEFRNGISDIHVKGGSYSATTFEGLTQGTGIRVDLNAGGTYIYKSFAHNVNIPYVFSCYVRTLDGSAPVLGDQSNDASADFVLVGKGSAIYTPYKSIIHLGNGLYRAIAVVTNGSTATSFGIVKYAGNSTKPIVVSGYQLEQASTVSAYQAFTDFNAEFMAQFPTHTLFQDVAGTIPVYAANQPVGLVLDKSKGLALSSELFNTALDFNNWNRTAAVTSFTANSFTTNGIGGCTKNPFFAGISIYKTYSIRVVGTSNTLLNIRGSGSIVGQVTVPAGSFDVTLRTNATLDGGTIYLQLAAAGTVTFNLISVKEILGNHASQTTTAARPMLRQTPILGFEHITNGSFTTDTSGWSPSVSTTITSVGGRARVTATASVNATMLRMLPTLAGRTVDVSIKFANRNGGTQVAALIWSQGLNFTAGSAISTDSDGTLTFRATIPNDFVGGIYVRLDGATTGQYVDFDDITVRDITGYTTDRNTLEFDGIDDQLTTVLGTPITGCTVLRAVPNIGTEIRFNQTIPVGYFDNKNHLGLVAINRKLSSYEMVKLALELDKKTGVKSLDTALVQTFAGGEQGFAYDPNDLSTLFQDAAGTIPVTSVGQPVGLVLDKSKNLTLSNDRIVNGDFSAGFTGWSNIGSWWTVVGGRAYHALGANLNALDQAFTATTDTATYLEFTAEVLTAANTAQVQFVPSGAIANFTTGTQRIAVPVGTTNIQFKRVPSTTAEFYLDNVSIRSILGNHATQSISSCRPVLGRTPITGLRNLTKYSEDSTKWVGSAGGTGVNPVVVYGVLAPDGTTTASSVYFDKGVGTANEDQSSLYPLGASLGTVAGKSYTASFWLRTSDGTTKMVRADFNGITADSGTSPQLTVTPVWTKFIVKLGLASDNQRAITIRLRATSTDNTAALHIWRVQFEEGLTATAYQKTNGNYDVIEAGVASANNLCFDGIDDFLVTNPIDFTSSDKFSLFTGIRKFSDAATGIVAELSVNTNTNNGSFFLAAPRSAGVSNIGFLTRGSSQTVADYNDVPAPYTTVLTAKMNIASDLTQLRDRGRTATSSADIGTSNLGNYPLFIGRRNGSALPFNGYIYGLIGISRSTTEAEISAIEKIIAKRTGVTLSV